MLEYKPNFGGAAAILQAAANVIAQAEKERLERIAAAPMLTDQEVADCLGRSLDAAGNILPRTFAREVLRAAHSPCRFASQCSEEGSCTNGCEARAPVAYLRPISQPDWLEVCQKGEPGAFPVYSKEAANG